MAETPSSRLQSMLQAAVQSVHWTYSIFWQFCPQQGILVWADGYYNGAIKTRKTIQPMEVSSEEASLQRSQQLRELYDSLSAGETNQPARRPCAALAPEDLTESEWFYLMCVSFSFPPAVGLPGKAYARRQHAWLVGANETDKCPNTGNVLPPIPSPLIETVLCIPHLDGVVEVGTTEKVEEDLDLVQHIKTVFANHHNNPLPPKPALSEHSTSNPATTSSDRPPRFYSPPIPSVYAAVEPPTDNTNNQELGEDIEDEEDEEDEEEDDDDSDSEAQTGGRTGGSTAEASELMQLEMPEDIRLGSPDDASNNLDSDFNMLAVSQNPVVVGNQQRVDSFRGESTRGSSWQQMLLQQETLTTSNNHLQLPPGPPLNDLSQEDTHYSRTVSTILQNQPTGWMDTSSSYMAYSSQSAFSKWTSHVEHHHILQTTPLEGTSQWLLKYILFSVPFLHNKYRDENSPKSRDGDNAAASRFRKGTPQDELSANHVLAERRRREKLNERFIILRSLVPFVTKMDKASILGDTIEYVKQLRKKIQDLEDDQRSRLIEDTPAQAQRSNATNSSKDQRSGLTSVVDRARVGPSSELEPGSDRRKLRIVEGSCGGAKSKTVDSPPPVSHVEEVETMVEVSIIERDALLELQCRYREGLLLDIMQMLRELGIEATVIQSSLNDGVLVAELRAKVKENGNGKKASIMAVKRAIKQIIPRD
ncbi:hypothetical protein ACFE04_031536 [Oxalis oulophora]